MTSRSVDSVIEVIGFGKFHVCRSLLAALVIIGESVELIMISFIVPFVACEWQLSTTAQAMQSVVFFLALLIGGVVWGKLADLYGRQRCLILTNVITFYFGVLSAFSPSHWWYLFFRVIVGEFYVSGCWLVHAQSLSLVSDFEKQEYSTFNTEPFVASIYH